MPRLRGGNSAETAATRSTGPVGASLRAGRYSWQGRISEGAGLIQELQAYGWGNSPGVSVQIIPQHLGTRRVAQLRHGLGLDLPDALAGHPVHLTELVEPPP